MNTDLNLSKHKGLTEKIIKSFYNVYNQLGYGFLEKIYENAMLFELNKSSIPVIPQSPIKVLYKRKLMGQYFVDLFVANKVIVESKATKNLAPEHEAQLLN